jgi:hypothetical protein
MVSVNWHNVDLQIARRQARIRMVLAGEALRATRPAPPLSDAPIAAVRRGPAAAVRVRGAADPLA